MMTILLLSAALAAPPSEWTFVDETTRDGRSMVTFRTVELAASPTRPLDAADKPIAAKVYQNIRATDASALHNVAQNQLETFNV